jgi:hypothetical protein
MFPTIPAGESFGDFINSEITGGVAPATTSIPSLATGTVAGSTPTWLSALSTALTGGAKIAQIANLPPGYTLNAAGQPVPIGGVDLSSIGSYLPWILGIGGLILLASAFGGRK